MGLTIGRVAYYADGRRYMLKMRLLAKHRPPDSWFCIRKNEVVRGIAGVSGCPYPDGCTCAAQPAPLAPRRPPLPDVGDFEGATQADAA